jgi:hypothetical protein
MVSTLELCAKDIKNMVLIWLIWRHRLAKTQISLIILLPRKN